ncbi:hypothetical protein [Spiroplasma endosymbiont of Dilophus febrilis]|uniref:hypothetical protein n=1 Tax=Spiroplasma endosymbiont of Dilophus febrilis TaxID=3066292 RepID=UPI00313ACC48
MNNSKNTYENIVNLLVNILQSSKLKLKVIKDDEFYTYFLRLVNSLLFLEQEHHANYEGQRYARSFVQVLADLRDEEIKIVKDDNLTLETIENDCNFLQTYILNIFQISKQELVTPTVISLDIVKELSNIDSNLQKQLLKNDNVLVTSQNNNSEQISNNNSQILKDSGEKATEADSQKKVNEQLINLQNLQLNLQGLKLPTHPANNQGFYPYTGKPKAMPFFKRVLSYVFMFLLAIVIGINVYGFVAEIKLTDVILKDNLVEPKSFNFRPASIAWNLSMWSIILEILTYAMLTYSFFKKPQFLRDKHRMQPMMLIFAIIAILFNSIYGVFGFLSYNSFVQFFKNAFDQVHNVDSVLEEIWSSSSFQVYRVLKIVGAGIAIIPILLIFIVFSINPRLDRDKLMQADLEYQKALQATLKGESYVIDASLFDQDLILEAEKQDENNKKHDL